MNEFYQRKIAQQLESSSKKFIENIDQFVELSISKLDQSYNLLDNQLDTFEQRLTPEVIEKIDQKTSGSTGARECSVTGCTRQHYAKGYCSTHYQQMRSGRLNKTIQQAEEKKKVEPPKKHFIRRREGTPDKHIVIS